MPSRHWPARPGVGGATHGPSSGVEVYAVDQLLNKGSEIKDIAVYTEQIGGKFNGQFKLPVQRESRLRSGAKVFVRLDLHIFMPRAVARTPRLA